MRNLESEDAAVLPNFRRFASEGIECIRAEAASSWTSPSHAVLFTGNEFYEGTELSIAEEASTLAEEYRDRGYVTIGLSTNQNIRLDNGFGQGFDVFFFLPSRIMLEYNVLGASFRPLARKLFVQTHAGATSTNKLLSRILNYYSDRPVFLFINYMDAHDPYLPSPESLELYYGLAEDNLELGILRPPGKALADFMAEDALLMTPEDIHFLKKLYLACLTDWDRGFAQLLVDLNKRQGLGPQLIVVTSDHGELFGEKAGFFTHKNQLLRPELEIPLVFGGSAIEMGARGIIFDRPVTHAQVGTLLKHLISPAEPEPIFTQIEKVATPSSNPQEQVLVSVMGPTEVFDRTNDLRGRYAKNRLAALHFPHSGVEILFADGELVEWRNKPNALNKDQVAEIAQTARAVASRYYENSPVLKLGNNDTLSPGSEKALKALGYIK